MHTSYTFYLCIMHAYLTNTCYKFTEHQQIFLESMTAYSIEKKIQVSQNFQLETSAFTHLALEWMYGVKCVKTSLWFGHVRCWSNIVIHHACCECDTKEMCIITGCLQCKRFYSISRIPHFRTTSIWGMLAKSHHLPLMSQQREQHWKLRKCWMT